MIFEFWLMHVCCAGETSIVVLTVVLPMNV